MLASGWIKGLTTTYKRSYNKAMVKLFKKDIRFDHDAKDFYTAIGVSDKRVEEIKEVVQKEFFKGFQEDKAKTEVLEDVIRICKIKNEGEFIFLGMIFAGAVQAMDSTIEKALENILGAEVEVKHIKVKPTKN